MSKKNIDNVTVYILRSKKTNEIEGKFVYLNEDHAKEAVQEFKWNGNNVYLDSIKLPFAGRHLSYISIYNGFDYGCEKIYDVTKESSLYPSEELAKTNEHWQKIMRMSKKAPDKYNVYENKICSRDSAGKDWCYGDVMEGNISAEIMKMKVIRC